MTTQTNQTFREETDLLGSKQVPESALYGVQTLRGIENFNISGIKMYQFPDFIIGLAITKMAAAIANEKVGAITAEKKDAIVKACQEIMDGKYHDQFPTDMIQGGAGTSVNMNANEVIANRALEIMGKKRGEYQFCSPNDDVNGSQSTNDAYPTGFHLAMYMQNQRFVTHLDALVISLEKKAKEFAHILKMGRTQLQDAVPMTLGQTFQGFATGLKNEINSLNKAAEEFLTVNMGATAIGTGISSKPAYRKHCTQALRDITKWDIALAEDLIEATSDTSCLVNYSSALKQLSIRLTKFCNDLRLMASGPRCGLQEIHLPEMQPGSSIMPGKVNPVMPEVLNQVCYKVIGNDTCIMLGASNAQLELNVMEPVMVYALFESVMLLTNGVDTFRKLCIDGIEANEAHTRKMMEQSIGIVTALNPFIGYKQSTKIAKEAAQTGKGVYELVLEHKILTKEQLDKILSPENMIQPVDFSL